MCQLLLSVNNKISADVELIVRRPPVISDNSTRAIIVSEGQPVRLECYANGHPSPHISWRRDNNAILPTGGSIFKWVSFWCQQLKSRLNWTFNAIMILFQGKYLENSPGAQARPRYILLRGWEWSWTWGQKKHCCRSWVRSSYHCSSSSAWSSPAVWYESGVSRRSIPTTSDSLVKGWSPVDHQPALQVDKIICSLMEKTKRQ